jgi:hypothetical protein
MTNREVDAAIADKVIGLPPLGRWCETCCTKVERCSCRSGVHGPWPYSTYLGYAYQVVEKLTGDGFPFSLNIDPDRPAQACFWVDEDETSSDDAMVEAETAPLAICLSALKLVGEKS